MRTHLVWFRQDLRVNDNPALFEACKDPTATVLAIFVATPLQWQHHLMSARQQNFLLAHVKALEQQLSQLGIPLFFLESSDYQGECTCIKEFCQRYQVNHLYYNHQYQYNESKRDKLLIEQLKDWVQCHAFHGNVLFPPQTLLTGEKRMYQVFTPFRQACLKQISLSGVSIYPKPGKRKQSIKYDNKILIDQSESSPEFPPGEDYALQRLEVFCKHNVTFYSQYRDFPARDMTSQLSPYLALGIISVRQCFQQLNLESPLFWQYIDSGAFCWFSELIWREFYTHLLVGYPQLSKHKAFIKWTEFIQWRNDIKEFKLWTEGQTGYPIVDAAMRQLKQTGWLHNRLRMIVASFLVKDLLIDWRWGENYFMSQLIDGDLAANNGGWQWAASTGCDSVPYFRIFNPSLQSKRFDTHGEYIRAWLPELVNVPDKFIHTPQQWAEKMQVVLDYPEPIVMHEQARKRVIEVYELAKRLAKEQ